MTEQTSTLVRTEVQLAKAEIQETVKDVGKGAGLFGGAGLTALYGVGALIATAILGLATVVDAWLAALIVTVVLFAVAAVLALAGKKKVSQAPPPVGGDQAQRGPRHRRREGGSLMTESDNQPDTRSIDEIERDLAQTREQLGATVEALGAKLDVKSRTKDWADDKKVATQQKTKQVTDDHGRELAIGAGVLVVALVGLAIWRARSS